MKTKHFRLFRFYLGRLSVVILIILFPGKLAAKDRIYPLSVTLMNESWAFPFSELGRFDPLYPGFTVGINRLRTDKLITFPQVVNVGYFYNRNVGSAAFLHVNQGIRSALDCGFFFEFSLGLGYFHAFNPGDIYQKQGEVYEKARNTGKPGLMVSFSQTAGFDLSRKSDLPLAPFIRYQWIASSPYFDMVIPIRPTGLVHLGTLIYF